MPDAQTDARATPIRLGFLYPAGYGDQEYYLFGEALGYRVYLLSTRLYGDDVDHEVGALLKSGDVGHLASAARKFQELRPASIMWACTSASFVGGVEWAEAQARAIAEASGRPASGTSLAFFDALDALGIARVAIMATYPDAVARRFEAFLAHRGVQAVNVHTLGILSGWDTPMPLELLRQEVAVADRPEAEAILIPDTAMPTLHLIQALEEERGKPILSANQVTLWKSLRLAGILDRPTQYGRIFER
jgi:maleate cis-trans isomerase